MDWIKNGCARVNPRLQRRGNIAEHNGHANAEEEAKSNGWLAAGSPERSSQTRCKSAVSPLTFGPVMLQRGMDRFRREGLVYGYQALGQEKRAIALPEHRI